MSKINRGSGVLVVRRQVSEGGTVKEGSRQGVESGGRTRLPLRSGARLPQRLLPWPTALEGNRQPGILARRRCHGCVIIRTAGPAAHTSGGVGVPLRTLLGPTRTSACMHREETGLPRRGALGV